MKKSSKSVPEVHERDVSIAQRERVPEAEQLAELRARVDQQLASLNASSAHQAMGRAGQFGPQVAPGARCLKLG